MTPTQIVDLVANHDVLVGSSDSNNTTWRRRIEERLNETVEQIWDEYDWEFKGADDTISLAVGDASVEGPANYMDIGEHGGLFYSNGERLEYLPRHDLFKRQRANGTSTGRARFYTVAGVGGSGGPLINFDIMASTADSLTFYYNQIPEILMDRPGAPTLADSGSPGNPNGTYFYKVSFVGIDGSESEAGTLSASITVTTNQINLTAIPTGNTSVTSRRLYRTVASGTDLLFLATLSDNTSTTYTDDIADGSLGAATAPTTQVFSVAPSFHRSVLAIGTVAKIAKDLRDPRAPELEAQYRAELDRMKSRRSPGSESLMRLGDEGLPLWRMH